LLIDPVPKEFSFSSQIMKKYEKGVQEAKIKKAGFIYKKYNGSEAEVIYQLLGFDESKRSIKHLGNINDRIPVIIISSTSMEKKHPLKQDWFISQKQWLNKNYLSSIIQVPSDHFIQLRHPQIVCNEIINISK
jgi:hypothetical protein